MTRTKNQEIALRMTTILKHLSDHFENIVFFSHRIDLVCNEFDLCELERLPNIHRIISRQRQ